MFFFFAFFLVVSSSGRVSFSKESHFAVEGKFFLCVWDIFFRWDKGHFLW
jgi:hypothetical protein